MISAIDTAQDSARRPIFSHIIALERHSSGFIIIAWGNQKKKCMSTLQAGNNFLGPLL